MRLPWWKMRTTEQMRQRLLLLKLRKKHNWSMVQFVNIGAIDFEIERLEKHLDYIDWMDEYTY